MILVELKLKVLEAHRLLPGHNLVTFTWGNVSGIDREEGWLVIKPPGVSYQDLALEKMVVVDMVTGKIIEGKLKPSSDTATHIELYRTFFQIGGVVR